MERRVFTAIILSFLVLYAYQALVAQPTAAKPTAARPASAAGTPRGGRRSREGGIASRNRPVEAAQPAVDAPPPVVSRSIRAKYHGRNATVEAVFTNRGGGSSTGD